MHLQTLSLNDFLLLVASSAATVFVLQQALRQAILWRYRCLAKKSAGKVWDGTNIPRGLDSPATGHIQGGVGYIPCGRCKVVTNNYYQYADGDRWCERCHEGTETV